MTEKFLIIIPAFNAASTLGNVIDAARRYMTGIEILVINDGSTDRTEEIARQKNVLVISHQKNLGKGAALKSAFQYALENDVPYLVTMDADLQHDPSVLPAMIKFFLEKNWDIVIGSRERNRRMSLDRIFSNTLTSWLISLRAKTKIPDSQSGYRILKTEVLRNMELTTSGYETESEIIILAGRNKCRFGFFPVPTIYANETSHIRRWRDTWRFVKMYFHTLLK